MPFHGFGKVVSLEDTDVVGHRSAVSPQAGFS